MSPAEAFPLIAEVSVMEDGRSFPHEFTLYSDGARTVAVGNVSTYAGYRPARILFDGNSTILYRPPDAVYDKPAAIRYAGTTRMLYGILPPRLILEYARFNETSGLYSGRIPCLDPSLVINDNDTSLIDCSFTVLSWTHDGFMKEYEVEVLNPSVAEAPYPRAVVSFVKILKQGQSATVDFDYDVFILPEGTEYRAPEDFGVVIA